MVNVDAYLQVLGSEWLPDVGTREDQTNGLIPEERLLALQVLLNILGATNGASLDDARSDLISAYIMLRNVTKVPVNTEMTESAMRLAEKWKNRISEVAASFVGEARITTLPRRGERGRG